MGRFSRWMFLLALLAPSALGAGKITLRVGYLPTLDHFILPVSHATDNARFEHLDVRPKLFQSWEAIVGALRAEKLDAAFLLAPLTLELYHQGEPLRVVLLAHRDGTVITVGNNSGIHSGYWLRGKTIAVPARQSIQTLLLNQFLLDAGLRLNEVHLRVVDPPNMTRALAIDAIDAFIVAEPYHQLARQQHLGKALAKSQEILPGMIDSLVVVRQRMLDRHRPVLQTWVDSLRRAGAWIARDQAANQGQTAAHLGAPYYPHDMDTLAQGLQNLSFEDLIPREADFTALIAMARDTNVLPAVKIEGLVDYGLTESDQAKSPEEPAEPESLPQNPFNETIPLPPDTPPSLQ